MSEYRKNRKNSKNLKIILPIRAATGQARGSWKVLAKMDLMLEKTAQNPLIQARIELDMQKEQ